MNNKFSTKVVFIGVASVGKTSLLNSYIKKSFTNNYRATVGSDYLVKDFLVDDQMIQVQFWDTAGQEKFIALGAPFYRGANCCVIVFDVNDQKSFEMLDFWRDEFIISSGIQKPEIFPFVILGNKMDLKNKTPDSKFIEFDLADQWCQSRGNITYKEVSCLDQDALEQAFQLIARKSMQQTEPKFKDPKQQQQQPKIVLTQQPPEQQKQVCAC